MTRLAFVAYGPPVGQGRVSFLGRGRAVHSNADRLLPWRDTVAGAARTAAALDDWQPLDGPVVMHCSFYLPRPKGHTGKRGLLPSAPTHPAGRPDLDHLVRAVGDALSASGVAWTDDSQVVKLRAAKHYCAPDAAMQTPGVVVEIGPVAL